MRLPPGGDRDHCTPKRRRVERTMKFHWRNHWVLNKVVTVFLCFLMCQLVSFALFNRQNLEANLDISTWAPPSGAETVSRGHSAPCVTCCYNSWLTCLSICTYLKCETNIHFYRQRSCLINGLYPWQSSYLLPDITPEALYMCSVQILQKCI